MGREIAKKSSKIDQLYMHIVVMLALIIGFHFIPPMGAITPIGMKLIGIFLAMLYGWTTCGMLWTSLLGIIALPFSGAVTMKEFLMQSFGNETIVFMLFIFVFTGVIDEVGLIDYIANKMISFKVLNGRPWLFSAFLLVGAYISSAFINMFASIIVFWGIIYIVAERFEFKPYDKYPTLMILGVVLASLIGGCVMPYKPVPLVVLKAYSTMAGVPMDFFKYICFSFPVTLAIMIFYVFLCRFVFRPDIKELHQISVAFADAKALILNKKQKIAIIFLFVFIFMMIAPSILPAEWLLASIINQLGIAGCLFLLLIVMHWIKFDGVVLLSFHAMAKHISWDMFLVMCFVIPFASIFTADITGIKQSIIQVMHPLLVGLSPMIFIILILFIATILTNIANNMVVGAVFATLIFTIGGTMGIDIIPIIAVLIVCCNLALATPAAAPTTAMVFANTKWCKAVDIYKYGAITVLIGFIFAACIGLVWAFVIY